MSPTKPQTRVFAGGLLSLGLLGGASAAGSAAATEAAKPDCTQAKTDVAKLICYDQRLPVLVQRHDGILANARRLLPEAARAALAEDEALWQDGHTACIKAEDPAHCLGMRYIERDAELQARHALVPADGPIRWDCGPERKEPFFVTFYETDPPSAIVRGVDAAGRDHDVVAISQPSASGARYVAGDSATFWAKRDEATVTWFGDEHHCRPDLD